MADSRDETTFGRIRTPGASRPSSRPSTPSRLQRTTSAGYYLDDHASYHGHRYDGHHHSDSESSGNESSDENDLSKHPSDEENQLEKEDTDVVPEVRDGIEDQRDVEAGQNLEKSKTGKSGRSVKDPNLVSWDGPEDPKNPKNWSMKRKWAATLVGKLVFSPNPFSRNSLTFSVSSFTFISPVSSSMVAPALTTIAREFNITSEVESSLVLSIFVLAYAVGPLFLGPLSEIFGRVIVLQVANLFYLVFNLACGFAQTSGQMIAFRFLSGLGGSAPLAIGGGVLSDCFTAEQRGKAISIYSLAPLLGPAVGPIAGGFITENTTWRWVFWATTIADALIQISGLFFLQETYAPVLLHRKKVAMIKETNNQALFTEYDHPERTLGATLRISLVRPFKLLGTQVIVQVLAVYMAFLYGLMYLVLSTFPGLWENVYGESISIGGLNYISLGLGFFIGTQVCAPAQDRIYRILKARNNGVGKPE